jgi:hypothetical protein
LNAWEAGTRPTNLKLERRLKWLRGVPIQKKKEMNEREKKKKRKRKEKKEKRNEIEKKRK